MSIFDTKLELLSISDKKDLKHKFSYELSMWLILLF